MEQTFLTSVEISKVRHLHDLHIPLSGETRKHLILTGKNGSGKTSVLDALAEHFLYVVSDNFLAEWENKQLPWTSGAVSVCTSYAALREKYSKGNFILAYYKADRLSKVEVSSTIESVPLKDRYAMNETPGQKLIKYMVGLKATQAFALQKNDQQRAAEIEVWFAQFEGILKQIFADPSVKLDFDIETFRFSILQDNREPFDFNTMSLGYSAVFDIINDLIMRMEKGKSHTTEGIVLIDEIETHLHIELQKIILPFLTEMFPNIQFIISSHSPFILNSIENAVIYDLENQTLAENGLASVPYDGIVEGYFHASKMANELQRKFDRYKALTAKEALSDEDYAEVSELECALDEIPDFLSPDIAAEYSRIKLEFLSRG